MSSCEKLSDFGEYLLQNLFRHLRESRRLAEAVRVLSHIEWTRLQVAHGGLNALHAEFSLVSNAIQTSSANEREQEARDDALQGIMNIWNMVGKAWALILRNLECLPTHAYDHLLDHKRKTMLIERYLDSARDIVSGPWLKPTKAFWCTLDSHRDHRIFRTAEKVECIALGSKLVIAATKNMLFWIDHKTMTAKREIVIRGENGSDSTIYPKIPRVSPRMFLCLDLVQENSSCATCKMETHFEESNGPINQR